MRHEAVAHAGPSECDVRAVRTAARTLESGTGSSGTLNNADALLFGRHGSGVGSGYALRRMLEQAAALTVLIFLAATLYGSVGHAGASGYLAAMSLVGISPLVMKPTALTLNILAATIVFTQFYRAGHFCWRTFWPFAIASIPLSFVGGYVQLPGEVYKPLVAVVLVVASARMIWKAKRDASDASDISPAPLWAALLAGGALGLLSGLTGTGGGIFLTPLLLLMNWARPRVAAGVSAAFILCNSVSGLAGNYRSVHLLDAWIFLWLLAAAVGAYIGSTLGSRKLAPATLRYLLAVVLLIAAGKLAFT